MMEEGLARAWMCRPAQSVQAPGQESATCRAGSLLLLCDASLVLSSTRHHMTCLHQLRYAALRRAAAGAGQMASQGLDAFSQSGLYSNHMVRPPAALFVPSLQALGMLLAPLAA